MKLLDELFDLGDAALEDQVAVVGLALGDLAGDGGQQMKKFLFIFCRHQPCNNCEYLLN